MDGGAGAEAGLRGSWAHTCRQLGVASELTEGSGRLQSYLFPAPWRRSCGLYPISRQSRRTRSCTGRLKQTGPAAGPRAGLHAA